MAVRVHELKCWLEYFDAVQRGEKRFEVRKDDRGFQKGDTVRLVKFDQYKAREYRDSHSNSRAVIDKKIKYVLTGGQFGIEPGYVVLGF